MLRTLYNRTVAVAELPALFREIMFPAGQNSLDSPVCYRVVFASGWWLPMFHMPIGCIQRRHIPNAHFPPRKNIHELNVPEN